MRRLISIILLLAACWTANGQEVNELQLYRKAFRYIRKDYGGKERYYWITDWLCDHDQRFFAENLDMYPTEKKLAETYVERMENQTDSTDYNFPQMKYIIPRRRESVKYVIIFSPIKDNMYTAEVVDIAFWERLRRKKYDLSTPNGLRDVFMFGETDQYLFVVKPDGSFLTVSRIRLIYN